MALSYNMLKVLAVVAAVLMGARLVSHGARRPPDWVVLLGLVWGLPMIVADIQHGNTNDFVLAGVMCHLWLFRRGRVWLSGLPLAAAICLKMTPAMFLLYWLYQRSWKVLAGAVVWLVALSVVAPAAAVGPGRYATLVSTWGRNLIGPGLLKGSWYPEHINQSLSGVVSRYFLEGRDGDVYWGPDDDPYYQTAEHGWITLVPLSPAAAKWVLRAGQLLIVALMAWVIGWRPLARDDGRRALHYGLIVLGMMLLNQRTWNHHAAVVLPAGLAVWQALAFGRIARRARVAAFVLTVAAGVFGLLARGELFEAIARAIGHDRAGAERWADLAKAAGPMFYFFALMLAASGILAVALRRADEPYALRRQRLWREDGAG